VTATGASPQGSVTFYVDGQAVFSNTEPGGLVGQLNSSNQATCCVGLTPNPLSSLGVGTHAITAIYSGDSRTQGSTSPTLNQVITAVPTTTTLSSTPNPCFSGQTVKFTATIGPFLEQSYGTVTFLDGAHPLGTVAVTAGLECCSWAANLNISNLTVGTHSITAEYSGNTDFAASVSAALQQVVSNGG